MRDESLEMDYLGVLPLDKESERDYVKRGEQFLEDAHSLKEILKKDSRGTMKLNFAS